MKIDSVRQSAYVIYLNNELRTSYLNWHILKGHQSQYSLVLIKTKKLFQKLLTVLLNLWWTEALLAFLIKQGYLKN